MTTDQLVPKSRDDLLRHTAAKGRLTFVLGPYSYGKARAGHTAYGIARAHLPAFVAALFSGMPTFTVVDAPEDSAVNLTLQQVTPPAGTSARVLGSFR